MRSRMQWHLLITRVEKSWKLRPIVTWRGSGSVFWRWGQQRDIYLDLSRFACRTSRSLLRWRRTAARAEEISIALIAHPYATFRSYPMRKIWSSLLFSFSSHTVGCTVTVLWESAMVGYGGWEDQLFMGNCGVGRSRADSAPLTPYYFFLNRINKVWPCTPGHANLFSLFPFFPFKAAWRANSLGNRFNLKTASEIYTYTRTEKSGTFDIIQMNISDLIHAPEKQESTSVTSAQISRSKRHKCSWPGCGKAFSKFLMSSKRVKPFPHRHQQRRIWILGRPSDTARHYRIHTNDR